MLRLVTAAALLTASFSPMAHHSTSMYDRETTLTLIGNVTRFDWANPHVYIYVEVAPAAGEPVVWEIEGQPPTILKRQGWSPDTLAVGDRVVVSAFAPRDSDKRIALGSALQKADGARLALNFNPVTLSDIGPGSASKANGLAGTWSTILDRAVAMPIIVGPVSRPDLPRRIPFNWELTEKGAETAEQYRQESMLPGIECIPFTSPFLMVLPDLKVIEIDGDVVRIRSEFEGVERTVHMSDTSHEGATASLQGHSIGSWDGDVLVVDTANFVEHRAGNAQGLPSGTGKHLVERFELNSDGITLTYRFELEDPEYLAGKVTGEVQWAYRPDLTYSAAECDLENARRFLGD